MFTQYIVIYEERFFFPVESLSFTEEFSQWIGRLTYLKTRPRWGTPWKSHGKHIFDGHNMGTQVKNGEK